ncbi:hypothetical protein CYY_000710 [Polysphondylium violaceum]|uniref:Thioredoxin domain-containing protein n=1 Tax=Polysphondylium violaceum TaxID=133409 RepID=A0A8J4UWX4_9MYCE|nr:hypothetical protein CYY_000710 [Polysphondylium violaceum]
MFKSILLLSVFICLVFVSHTQGTAVNVPSATGWPILLNSTFLASKYDRSDNKLIVIYFTKDDCPPCDILSPMLAPWLHNATYSSVEFYEVNFSHFLNIPSDYEALEVTSLPSIKFYRNYEATEDGYVKFLWQSSAPVLMYTKAFDFINVNY